MIDRFRLLRSTVALLALPALFLAGCKDATGPVTPVGTEVAVVVNSNEFSITVIPVDDPGAAYTIGVAPEGSPVSVAARGEVAVVPLGIYPFAAVVNLTTRAVAHTVALPENSGATGVAFLNDSIALVGNPDLNSVTPVNVRRGTTGAAIPVGVYPQAIVAGPDGRAYVINANLVEWTPAGPGSVTVIDGNLNAVATIPLSGLNPGSGAFGPDGRLYVAHMGNWDASNGSLSVVDVSSRQEVSHHTGFGYFPGSVAATAGRVLVTLYGDGIVEWNPATASFVRGPDNPLTPGSTPPVSSIGFDSEGRIFALNPGSCEEPGRAYRLSAAGEVLSQTTTGICPFGLAFTFLPAG